MAISFSRPDPSSPSAVASAAFTTSRKGYEQAEVREFLRMVAAELARLQEREKFLERELRTTQRSAPTSTVALDEEVVTRMLGEEAARILTTAREAATQIKSRAEDGAARLLREAGDEAQRVRAEAEIEAARRRNDAASDAESELEMAKQQGREMVNEARAYRERVLSELARRRELARQQIEQLVHGRDRLLQAFERARSVAVDVMADLTPLVEPAEYVDLSPTTGPVPIIVARQPPPSVGGDDPTVQTEVPDVHLELVSDDTLPDVLVSEINLSPDAEPEPEAMAPAEELEETVAPPEEQPVDTADVAPVIELFAEPDVDVEVTVEVELADGELARADVSDGVDVSDGEDATLAEGIGTPAAEAEPTDEPAGAIPPEGDEPDAAESTMGEPDETTAIELSVEHDATTATPRGEVDDLFARLRAARAEGVARRAGAGAEPQPLPVDDHTGDESSESTGGDSVFKVTSDAPPEEPAAGDETAFSRRDAALTPVIVAAARKLKRVLADEQNDVLHTLRRKDAIRSVEALLTPRAEHVARYATAITAELDAAATAGATSMGGTIGGHARAARDAAVAAVDGEIVAPLRDRLSRSVADADGDNSELAALARVVYREWKSQRIDEHLDDIVRIAFGRGALAAAGTGTPIRWVVDPNGPDCPDAEDNALAGAVAAGQPFPTDHLCAPAHSGCTCMIARATP